MPTITDNDGDVASKVADVSLSTKQELYYQITVTTSSATLESLIGTTIPKWAQFAFIIPEISSGTIAMRYRADNTAPTANIGVPIVSFEAWPLQGYSTIKNCKLISVSGSITVNVVLRG